MNLGPTPAGETCIQLGSEDYNSKARNECRVYLKQLGRLYPNPPAGIRFGIRSFPHDFGSYLEVVVYFEEDEDCVNFAYDVESNLPEFWDETAKLELKGQS